MGPTLEWTRLAKFHCRFPKLHRWVEINPTGAATQPVSPKVTPEIEVLGHHQPGARLNKPIVRRWRKYRHFLSSRIKYITTVKQNPNDLSLDHKFLEL